MNEEVVLIPLGCFALAALAGFVLGRLGQRDLGRVLIGAGTLAFLVVAVKSQTATGWDGLGWFILAALMILPALIGGGIGLVLGLWRRRRVRAS